MPNISRCPDKKCIETTELILESNNEIISLPTSTPNALKPAICGYDSFKVGSTAFCPSTQDAWVLAATGWIKIT